MFKRIVSHLSLSPSAVSEMAFYARRLRQERVTRVFSAIAAVLVVGLQFATIAAPPSPTNAASPNDIIYGGFVSKDDLLNRYDASAELQSLYKYFGIARTDVVAAKTVTINSRDHSLQSIGRLQHTADDQTIAVGAHVYYGRPLYIWDTGANVKNGSSYQVLQGTRASDGGYFAIMFHCGNIVFKTLPPKPVPIPPPKPTPIPTPVPTPTPKPTPKPTKPAIICTKLASNLASGEAPLGVGFTASAIASGQTIASYSFNFGDGAAQDTPSNATSHTYKTAGKYTATVSVKGSTGAVSSGVPACAVSVNVTAPPAAFTKSKSALNLTQNKDAVLQPAQAGDQIRYTLTTKNVGGTVADYAVVEHLEDVLEYANLTDTGGATLTGGVLTWPSAQIKPGTGLVKTFTVVIKDPIPATPAGVSDKFSYDLRLDNVYGTQISIAVAPPLAKQVESASTSLPATGPATNTIVVLVVAFLALFFYLRNRQLVTEIKLLRGSYQGGL